MNVKAMQTEVTRITDARRSLFIESRERGAMNFIVKTTEEIRRGSRRSQKRSYYSNHPPNVFSPVNVLHDLKPGDFAEVYLTPKTGILSIKKVGFENVSTPYILTSFHANTKNAEVALETQNYCVVTSTERRRAFALDLYTIALQSGEPIHKISSLKALEQLFMILAINSEIEKSFAEKTFEKYEKLSARMWRSTFAGEQVTCFQMAWKLLANATGIMPKGETL